MKKIDLVTVILFGLQVCLSPSVFAGGSETGNGGDNRERQFIRLGEQLVSDLNEIPLNTVPQIDLEQFKNAVANTKVFVKRYVVNDQGTEIAAKNYPDELRIDINAYIFPELKYHEQYDIALHEYLCILRLEESNRYTLSSALIRIMKSNSKLNSLEEGQYRPNEFGALDRFFKLYHRVTVNAEEAKIRVMSPTGVGYFVRAVYQCNYLGTHCRDEDPPLIPTGEFKILGDKRLKLPNGTKIYLDENF